MTIAHSELEKLGSQAEQSPGYWVVELKGADWTAVRKFYGGAAVVYKINAHSGKIAEVRMIIPDGM